MFGNSEEYTVYVNKNDGHCGKHFRYYAALPLQMQLQTIHKRSCTMIRKLMRVQTQHSSEEAF